MNIRGGTSATSLLPLNEEELEDFILENSPRIKKLVAGGEKARQAGEVISLEEYQAALRR